jgi:hypothetical protein
MYPLFFIMPMMQKKSLCSWITSKAKNFNPSDHVFQDIEEFIIWRFALVGLRRHLFTLKCRFSVTCTTEIVTIL